MAIHFTKLIKKNVEYIDSSGKFRIGKVNKVKKGRLFTGRGKYRRQLSGIIITVTYGKNKREKVISNKVLYWIHHRNYKDYKEEIVWAGTLEEFQERMQKKKPRRQRRQKQEKKKEATEQKEKQQLQKETAKDEEQLFPMKTMQTTLFAKGMVMLNGA